jgi:hypothetical protein
MQTRAPKDGNNRKKNGRRNANGDDDVGVDGEARSAAELQCTSSNVYIRALVSADFTSRRWVDVDLDTGRLRRHYAKTD